MIEHRKSARHDVEVAASMKIDGADHPTVIQNLSVGGALVAFEARLPPETRVSITFRVPTHDSAISVGATVRWVASGTIGIQFDGLRAAEVWALNKYFDTLPG